MKIIREKTVRDMTGLSRVTRWRQEREGLFPARIRIGKCAIGWREDEVIEWITSRQRVQSRAEDAA
jgi:prophage regulatory protein